MRGRCLNKNGKNPTYQNVHLNMTLDEWLTWAIPKYTYFLAENPESKPCVSRYGDIGDYEIGNISIISVSDNCKLQKTQVKQHFQLKDNGYKVCSRCNVSKVSGSFSLDRKRKDKLSNWCRECCSIYMQTYKRKS